MASDKRFIFVNKDAKHSVLSRSNDTERALIFSHVQRKSNAIVFNQPNSRSAYLQKLLSTFIEDEIARAKEDVYLNFLPAWQWSNQLPNLYGRESEALTQSLNALACTAVGHLRHDNQLIQRGFFAYGHALSALRNSLSTSDSTLSACVVLARVHTYDESWTRSDWENHVSGIASIMQLRRPSSFRTCPLLFSACRDLVAYRAARGGQQTFLSSDSWRNDPWSHGEKTPYHYAQDGPMLVADLWSRLPQREAIITSEGDIMALCERCLAVADEIMANLSHAGTAVKSLVATCLRGSVTPKPARALFPSSFDFDSLKGPVLLSVFWGSLVELGTFIDQLTLGLREAERSTGVDHGVTILMLKSKNHAEHYAKNICMTVQYCAKHSVASSTNGGYYLTYGMGAACRWFERHQSMADWAAWCSSVVDAMERNQPLKQLVES